MFRTLAIFLLTLLLVSCAGKPDFDVRTQPNKYKEIATIQPPIGDPIIIAVYDFIDLTGQKKPGNNFASMSTAVTQGSYQLLIKALQDAGDGKWFRVVERTSLPSLLQERKLIRSTRQQIKGDAAEPLPPLLFAGAYITGGIVGYDSNTKSGGLGARNEPVTYAIRKAIEKGVVELINQGAKKNVWEITPVPEVVLPEDLDEEVKTKEEVKIELKVEQQEPAKIKTRAEYLAEKKARKELKKAQNLEVKNYNKENKTKFKTWDEYQEELKRLAAIEVKEAEKEERRALMQIKLECEKSANATGKVSEKCTDLIDEKDWADLDKTLEEENTNEENDNGSSDSSSDNN